MNTHQSNAITLAGELSRVLLEERDDNERCLLLSAVLRVLAEAMTFTDAYAPTHTLASEISHQVKKNQQFDDETQANLERWNPAHFRGKQS